MGFLDDLLRGAQDVASRAFDQANPWDDGKDWNQRTATPQKKKETRPQPRTIQYSPQVQRQMAQQEQALKQSQANVFNPLAVIGDVAKATQDAGKGIGSVLTDTVNGVGNRIADGAEAGAEIIREMTGENQAAYNEANKRAAEYRQMAQSFAQRAAQEQNPARRQAYIDQIRSLGMAESNELDRQGADIQRGLTATDPRKTLTNAAETVLDVATAGRGTALMKGLQPAATQVTKQTLGQLGKNAARTTAEGAALGAGYGTISTARDENATIQDYLKNAGTGALIGGGLGLGAQVAAPVAGKAIKATADAGAKKVAQTVRKHEEMILKNASQGSPLTTVRQEYINPTTKKLDPAVISQHKKAILNGNIDPIIVSTDNTGYVNVLDGEHRLAAYKELGVETVPTRSVSPAQLRMMKQGGYIGKGDEGYVNPTDKNYINEQSASYNTPDEFVNDIVERIWANNKTGKGVDTNLIPDEYGGGFSGRTSISNNSSFYRDFYAEYGRKPSKAAIKEMVEQTIKGKTDGNFKNLLTQEEISHLDSSIYDELMDRQTSLARQVTQEPTPTAMPEPSAITAKARPAKAVSQFKSSDEAVKSFQRFQKTADKLDQQITANGETPDLIADRDWFNAAAKEAEADIKKYWKGTKATPPKKPLPANIPQIDTKQYVKQQTKAQKTAGKTASGFKDKTADFKEKFIDDLAPIEDRLNKAIKNGTSVDPKDHITYQLDRSRRAEGIMNAYVRDNGLDNIIQNVKSTKEFDQYLIARHAKELGDDIKTGRDPIKDAALVKQLDAKYAEKAKELYKYNQKLLDSSVDYGLISKATADSLKKQYPEYVPFNRIFNEDELTAISGGAGKGNASLSKQTVVQRLKGSDRAIASPLNSIIDKTRLVVEQGERNRAAKMLVSYKDIEGNPFNLREISPKETIGTKSTVSYLDNGKKRTFETDKEISDAAKNMTREEIGMWGRIAAIPARTLRGGATTLNIGFAGANVVKDIVGAAINSRHPFRIADPQVFGQALAAALRHNGKHYQELMREGVAGTSFDMYRNPLKSNVNELRSHKNLATRTAYNVTHPGQWVRTLENTIGRSEDFGRALQYYSNKKGFKGDNANILAADQARNNSTNFFRHGSVGKNVNLAIPYWNAGVQGARIQGRRVVQRPVQTIAKIGFVIAAPSAMIAMNNYGDEKKRAIIEDIPQYEKDGNIIIVGPDAKFNEKTGKYDGVTKIPVPPQHIGVHKSIQDAVRSAFTGEAFDAAKNIGRVVEDYTTINPTDPQAVASRYIPQALKLVAEPMTNTNFFTGNKIVPDSQKNLPNPDQYNEYSSGTAKVLGKITNQSPRMIDNSIRTGLGGAGQNAVNATDSLLASMGLIKKEEIQGRSIADSVTGRFQGASAINPADKADKQMEKYKKELTATDAYKNASQYDKSRMLNRLETDIKAVEYDKQPAKNGQEKDKLTTKQQSLATDGFKADTYTDLTDKRSASATVNATLAKTYKDTLKEFDALSTEERDKKIYNENDAEYRLENAKYENAKANGTLTKAEAIKAQDKLSNLKIGSKFSKETRELYSLNKTQLTSLIDKGEITEKQANDILALSDAFAATGKTNKFRDKNGNIAIRPKAKGGSGRKKGTGKGKIPKSDDNTSTINLVANLSRKVANAKVAKRALPTGGGIRAPGIQAYKKTAKTNVSMTRKA